MKSASSILLLFIFLLILRADEGAGFAATIRKPAGSILFKKVTIISLRYTVTGLVYVSAVSSARCIKLIVETRLFFPRFSAIFSLILVSKTILQFICGEIVNPSSNTLLKTLTPICISPFVFHLNHPHQDATKNIFFHSLNALLSSFFQWLLLDHRRSLCAAARRLNCIQRQLKDEPVDER